MSDPVNMNDTVDRIQAYRAANNQYWMDLLQLALATAPEEARIILGHIRTCDAAISRLMHHLTEAPCQS